MQAQESAQNPYNYNKIEELEDHWLLWKNTDTKPIGYFPLKNVTVTIGQHANGSLYINNITYPKELYKKDEVVRIAEKTVECTMCTKNGIKILPWDQSGKSMPYKKEFGQYIDETKKSLKEPHKMSFIKRTGDFLLPDGKQYLIANLGNIGTNMLLNFMNHGWRQGIRGTLIVLEGVAQFIPQVPRNLKKWMLAFMVPQIQSLTADAKSGGYGPGTAALSMIKNRLGFADPIARVKGALARIGFGAAPAAFAKGGFEDAKQKPLGTGTRLGGAKLPPKFYQIKE